MPRCAIGVALVRGRPCKVGAGASAGKSEIALDERVQRLGIELETSALSTRRACEADAQPFEIPNDAVDEFVLAPAGIQVFNAQKQRAVDRRGRDGVAHRAVGVTKMEATVGRRGETEDRAGGG